MNYYNDNDPHIGKWLRALIDDKLIPDGEVDTRSISDVTAGDVRGFTQCHWFAGIGGWSYALQFAGWPESEPVWTGSCPCQPFSVANVFGKAQSDERHLWPEWLRIIRESHPAVIFGEQVYGAVSKGWLDEVLFDLEEENYACGAMLLRAKDFGFDHERKRIYWYSNAIGQGWKRHKPLQCISLSEREAQSLSCDEVAGVRRALDGDFRSLLHSDGLSVVMERHALKGYGNSIVPEVAASVVRAFLDAS